MNYKFASPEDWVLELARPLFWLTLFKGELLLKAGTWALPPISNPGKTSASAAHRSSANLDSS